MRGLRDQMSRAIMSHDMDLYHRSSFAQCPLNQAIDRVLEEDPDRRRRVRTLVILMLTSPSEPAAAMARWMSSKLIFATWLLWSISLIPSAPPSLLAKKISLDFGAQIGAS